MMPLIFLAVTTCSFLLPASATTSTPSHLLKHQSQSNQFHSLSRSSVLKAPPLSAEKIGLPPTNNIHHAPSHTSTSLHNAATEQISIGSLATSNEHEVLAEGEKITSQPKTLRGEHQTNIVSRLLYTYASQLLDISSNRQLEVTDALPLPDHVKMEEQVTSLEGIYNRCKAKAHKHLETLKSSSSMIESSSTTNGYNLDHYKKEGNRNRLKRKINNRIAKSESLILVKALLLHQKENLVITGILRLCNTLIQAFPAILVSRLLKLIESGDMHHPSKAIMASLQLIALLSIKMIIENRYFHNVINCATLVRGSLTGLIFDKSLRLSSSSIGGLSSGSSSNNSVKDEDNDDDDSDTTPKAKRKKKEGIASLGTGGILNLMQTDVGIIESAAMQIHTIWGKSISVLNVSFMKLRNLTIL